MLLASSWISVRAQVAPNDCVLLLDNPFGTCDGCNQQIFLNNSCTEAFVCSDSGDGCYLTCPDEGYTLVPNFGDDGTTLSWLCYEEIGTTCPGPVKIYCPGEPDEVPAGGITQADSSRCECDGQLYVSPDCKHADICRDLGENNFVVRNDNDCEDDETIQFDYLTWETTCADNVDNCPGQGGFSLGCQDNSPTIPVDPQCTYTDKPFTTFEPCECDNQVFINEDCTQAFLCLDILPEGQAGEGCLVECNPGQKIYPEFSVAGSQVDFTCVDEEFHSCPGEFNIACASDPVDPVSDPCFCDGEILISPDCQTLELCRLVGNPGTFIKRETTCEDGDIIHIDFQRWTADCAPDTGNCPEAGGLQWGCGTGSPALPFLCGSDGGYGRENTLGAGQCDCNGRTYINAECDVGLFCNDGVPNNDFYDGCNKVCGANELLVQNLTDPTGWSCASEPADCLGQYEVPCPGEYDTLVPSEDDCINDGDIIVGTLCTTGFFCQSGGGSSLTCSNAGDIIVITNAQTGDFACVDPAVATCPPGGGYRYGTYSLDTGGGSSTASMSSSTSTVSTSSFTTLSTSMVTEIPVGIDPNPCILESNPLGTCDSCEGQVFLNNDCSQAYECAATGDGCTITCPEGYKLAPDFGANGLDVTWRCIEAFDHICAGAFKIYCPGEPDEVPAGGITQADSSRCECDGQLYVSPDCKHADICRDLGENNFVVRNDNDCEDDETIQFDYLTWETTCADNVDNCPGQGGFSLGCQDNSPTIPVDPQCTYTDKPFTTFEPCECDNQVFINEDCTQAFLCLDILPEGQAGEGCLVECNPGQKIYPEFSVAGSQVDFTCVDEEFHSCPGEFNIACASDPVDPVSDPCFCDGEILISPDCQTLELCRLVGNPGTFIKRETTCEDGDIIHIDFQRWTADCAPDTGNCPEAGGLQWGCGTGSPALPFLCGSDGGYGRENTLGAGQCDCNGRTYINAECDVGLFCNDGVPNNDFYDGCNKVCGANELLVQNLTDPTGWSCASEPADCLGQYEVPCPGEYDTLVPSEDDCINDGDIIVGTLCTTGFFCQSGGGSSLTCSNAGDIIVITNAQTGDFACVDPAVATCPPGGGYRYGTYSLAPTSTSSSTSIMTSSSTSIDVTTDSTSTISTSTESALSSGSTSAPISSMPTSSSTLSSSSSTTSKSGSSTDSTLSTSITSASTSSANTSTSTSVTSASTSSTSTSTSTSVTSASTSSASTSTSTTSTSTSTTSTSTSTTSTPTSTSSSSSSSTSTEEGGSESSSSTLSSTTSEEEDDDDDDGATTARLSVAALSLVVTWTFL